MLRVILDKEHSLYEFLKLFIDPEKVNQIRLENKIGSSTYRVRTLEYRNLKGPKTYAHTRYNNLVKQIRTWDLECAFPYEEWKRLITDFHVLSLFL